MSRWAALAIALLLTGCARYFYAKPNASRGDFRIDSVACARDVGVVSGNGQYARVMREPFQRCMIAKGWTREKKMEPVEYGWFRGVEDDDAVDLQEGPTQPAEAGPTRYR